jgi:hypothetical protein
MAKSTETRVRELCLELPEVSEHLSHGAPAFFVGKQFLMLWIEGHHNHDFAHLWCAAPEGAQEELIAQSSGRVFYPPYVGARGWIGVRLDGKVDWDELAMFIEDAYRRVATKRQINLLES